MNDFGRISVCGAISLYNDTVPTLVPCVEPAMVFKQLRMEGFLVHRWTHRFLEGMGQMSTWIQEVCPTTIRATSLVQVQYTVFNILKLRCCM